MNEVIKEALRSQEQVLSQMIERFLALEGATKAAIEQRKTRDLESSNENKALQAKIERLYITIKEQASAKPLLESVQKEQAAMHHDLRLLLEQRKPKDSPPDQAAGFFSRIPEIYKVTLGSVLFVAAFFGGAFLYKLKISNPAKEEVLVKYAFLQRSGNATVQHSIKKTDSLFQHLGLVKMKEVIAQKQAGTKTK